MSNHFTGLSLGFPMGDPRLDLCDLYAFQQPNDPTRTVIILNANLNADVVTLEVRVSNKQAQTLYEKYGFQKVGIRRAYYTDNGEDAIIMTTDSLNSTHFQDSLQKLKHVHEQKWGLFYENEALKAA